MNGMSDFSLAILIAFAVWLLDGGAGHVFGLLLLVAFIRSW